MRIFSLCLPKTTINRVLLVLLLNNLAPKMDPCAQTLHFERNSKLMQKFSDFQTIAYSVGIGIIHSQSYHSKNKEIGTLKTFKYDQKFCIIDKIFVITASFIAFPISHKTTNCMQQQAEKPMPVVQLIYSIKSYQIIKIVQCLRFEWK